MRVMPEAADRLLSWDAHMPGTPGRGQVLPAAESPEAPAPGPPAQVLRALALALL